MLRLAHVESSVQFTNGRTIYCSAVAADIVKSKEHVYARSTSGQADSSGQIVLRNALSWCAMHIRGVDHVAHRDEASALKT